MKLEQLVTTYEQSKKLQELRGKILPSFFVRTYNWYEPFLHMTMGTSLDFIKARTAEELAEILPLIIKDDKWDDCWLTIDHADVWVWTASYYGDWIFLTKEWETLTEALGNLLIYLLENSLFPSDEVHE